MHRDFNFSISSSTLTFPFLVTALLLAWSGISDQIRSVAQSCPTLCNPMNRSTPGLPVHHQLPQFTQTHVHRVSDAIQPPHPHCGSNLPNDEWIQPPHPHCGSNSPNDEWIQPPHPHCGSNSPSDEWCWVCFPVLVGHLNMFFGEVSIQALGPFLD